MDPNQSLDYVTSENLSWSPFGKNKEWISEDTHLYISNSIDIYALRLWCVGGALKGRRFDGSPLVKIFRMAYVN